MYISKKIKSLEVFGFFLTYAQKLNPHDYKLLLRTIAFF